MISLLYFFLMIRRPPRSTLDRSSAASDVYKRQTLIAKQKAPNKLRQEIKAGGMEQTVLFDGEKGVMLSLIHISEPTRPY